MYQKTGGMMKPQCLGRGGEQRLESLSIASEHQDARDHPSNQIKCDECNRSFRRESDRKRHKCISE